MRKMMMMALMVVGMTAFASEKNDTTIIENANKVMIITGDSVQIVKVDGKEGNRDYYYEKVYFLDDGTEAKGEWSFNDAYLVTGSSATYDEENNVSNPPLAADTQGSM